VVRHILLGRGASWEQLAAPTISRDFMRFYSSTLLTAASLAAFLVLPGTKPPGPNAVATATVDTALARMGGADALRRIERSRFETVTLWHRQTFENRPFADVVGSYELGSDLRDYTLKAWRNTRRFVGPAGMQEITDIARDTVSIRNMPRAAGAPPTWGPLSIAYVDERDELFAFTPERLLLVASSATDARLLSDSTIDGKAYGRVAATIHRYPATIFTRRSDGFLAMVRYRAAQPNDFGLAPFGDMEVEVWYSRWAKLPLAGTGGIAYPMQWDIKRAGHPYKRITLLGARFNQPTMVDSFAVSDALRSAYFVTASRAMWDLPMDSAKIIDQRFAMFGQAGPSTGAVKLGRQWVLLETSAVPSRVDAEQKWLERADPGTRIGAGIVTTAGATRGGIAWLARHRLPVYVPPGASRGATTVLGNWKQPTSALTVVDRGRWLRIDGDSMWVESVDLPDSPGAMVVYVPSLRWMYSAMAAAPLQLDLLMTRAALRKWNVERIGSVRAIVGPAPARTADR
jgi:hypothetical protein